MRPQCEKSRAHLGRDFAVGQARPRPCSETIRHERGGLTRGGHDDRPNERVGRGDAHGALGGECPLEPEVAFVPRLRVRRNEQDEEHALLGRPADLCDPLVAVLQTSVQLERHLGARHRGKAEMGGNDSAGFRGVGARRRAVTRRKGQPRRPAGKRPPHPAEKVSASRVRSARVSRAG